LGGCFVAFVKTFAYSKVHSLEGFWLSNNWKLNYVKVGLSFTRLIFYSKDSVICPYCGPKNLKPTPTYTPFRDLKNEDFVLVRPYDPLLVPIWLGRT
jgi:hypothetical protein